MIFKKFKSFFGALLIILGAGFLISFLLNGNVDIILNHFWMVVLYSSVIGILLWQGNAMIIIKIRESKKLQRNPLRAFVLSSILNCLYSVFIIYLVDLAWSILIGGVSFSEYRMPPFFYFVIVMVITLIISFANYIKEFIIDQQKAIIREEKMKNEIIKLEYETLKNQVNPHFLFNSLNALTSLVGDNDEAVKFIKKLSDVYRYVLEQKDKEIVDLARELDFVAAFLYLHQIRFGENLQVEMTENLPKKMVVPLAVQMLVENAIKHNEISAEMPLKISIYFENDYLVVKNKLQPKLKGYDSSKIGISNIRSRYAHFTDKEIIAGIDNNSFVVKLPLLSMV